MQSSTSIATTEARRIAKRLLNHWKHKFEVAETEHDFKIFMPTATVTLTPLEQTLEVLIRAENEDTIRLEGVVLDHLNRMAQQEFEANWTHQ
ncbi:DUF2218 domain-containing protein [Acinetobacter sp. S40]|uniref:DUF2218 domain-containing protein n=1 Tax=unclassified Acinetobacter TaxID=196816 RepID=UPI00190CB4C7|nr:MULTISPECIES: DUF2218 domain-containing protein [unclassified Acinetobacter]MBJ9985941.1 DUF2218 domain-containing protein [Acinetobacter sp. S40]MBK0064444.1 DUF2218 domain-containing protein [Acinetobacter sp. S55]MBK0067142.1 DUF2218 domain-containing protein [Acinetobacter sp. S54]